MDEEIKKREHDLKNALLLIKSLSELFEAGFEPNSEERTQIAHQLKKAYTLLKDKIQ